MRPLFCIVSRCHKIFNRFFYTMATLEFGPLVTDARGSIRGTTFSRVRSGPTARGRPRPKDPNRLDQLNTQRRIAYASGLWQSLTAAQRADWDSYGATVTLYDKLGHAFNPTGHQMFVRNLMFQLQYPISPLELTAPVVPGLSSAPTYTWEFDGDDLVVTGAIVPAGAGDKGKISIYRPVLNPSLVNRFLEEAVYTTFWVAFPQTIIVDYIADFDSGAFIYFSVGTVVRDTDRRVSNITHQLWSYTKT